MPVNFLQKTINHFITVHKPQSDTQSLADINGITLLCKISFPSVTLGLGLKAIIFGLGLGLPTRDLGLGFGLATQGLDLGLVNITGTSECIMVV